MRALVTGSEGFIGTYLVDYLASKNLEVFSSVKDEQISANIERENKLVCDVRDMQEVNGAIAKSEPDVIFHLAAQSYPTISYTEPAYTLDTNVIGTANIFESVRLHDLDPIIIIACSSAEYGMVKEDEVPVVEDHPLNPLHPYGVSKVAQDLLGYQYFENYGMKAVRARLFNTTGPGKVNDVVSDLSKRIVECERDGNSQIVHGNLDARRDITDVRDMVKALFACTKAKPGLAYNLCSTKAHKISDILKMLIDASDLKIDSVADPTLMRPSDEPVIMGDNARFRGETGWFPTIEIEKTVQDTLDWWRATLNGS